MNQIYSVIGAEVEHVGLENLFDRITLVEQDQIFGACSRLRLIDSIQYTKSTFESFTQISADALQIYMYCTCFDSLADRNIEGVGDRFRCLFNGLNKHLKDQLFQSYLFLKEPEEDFEFWEKLSPSKKLARIIDYIYKFRRNTFTHQAKFSFTAFENRGVLARMPIVPPNVWERYSIYFSYRFPRHSEPSLLRLIVIGKIRQMLKLEVGEEFISFYWNNLAKFYSPKSIVKTSRRV
ncbi:MAG: hypothetical protein J0M11_10835 [Anaerolineae bacterium]|nr:hypothetical protein [Anaerolineae bacterium]